MNLQNIGRVATRYRYIVILGWIIAAVVITVAAPNLADVAISDMGKMLPSDTLSDNAATIYEEAFPGQFAPSSIVIVVEATGDTGILDQSTEDFAEQVDTEVGQFLTSLDTWLTASDSLEIVQNVVSPVASVDVAHQLVDPSNQVALVSVNFTVETGEEIVTETLDEIGEWLTDNRPDGVNTYLTGEAAIVNGLVDAGAETMESTLMVTVALVIVLLLLIYRSPISPFIPLFAVTLSYLVTRGIVAILAQDLLEVSTHADILLVVVIFGAGTDYCLFLISRFREEMVDQTDASQASMTMVVRVGETITGSAGTVFVGFMAMMFAEFGVLNTSGPTLAIGIVVSWLAGLTLVPAMLSILGQRTFWPGKATHRSTGRVYATVSRFVVARPRLVMVVTVLAMLPLAISGLNVTLSFDNLSDLPDGTEIKDGFEVIQDALGPGNMYPLTVIVTDRDVETMAEELVSLEQELNALDGIAQVANLNNPTSGESTNFLRVDTQLGLLMQMMASQSPEALVGIPDYLNLIVERFPELADSSEVETVQNLLADPDSLSENQAALMAAIQGLMGQVYTIEDPYVMITEMAQTVPAVSAMLAQLFVNFVTEDGTGYQMTLLLSEDPQSNMALDTVEDIRDILQGYEGNGHAVLSGQPAVTADMREIVNSDLLLTIGVVLAGIFVVLVVMLRSLVVPLYLAGSVVLSYFFTLGLTQIVFEVLLDTEGVPFILPIFSFVFLVALGVDYCIFLIGRVKEEIAQHGIQKGVQNAIESTAAIITSAGIVLAGTFGSMLVGEIMMLKQLGFAVAVGVLVETIVVCTLLVPAITVYLGKLAWWPGSIVQDKNDVRQHVSTQGASVSVLGD